MEDTSLQETPELAPELTPEPTPEPTAEIELIDYRTGSRNRIHFGVNGKIRELTVSDDTGTPFRHKVTAAELAALETSHVEFRIVTPLPETGAGEEVASGSAASSETEELETAGEEQPEDPAKETEEQGEEETDAQAEGAAAPSEGESQA